MRIAALYDIHGNLPALEAVLDEVQAADPDMIVAGGDILPGPMPAESLALLRSLTRPVRFIMGNGDREVLAERAGTPSSAIPEAFRDVMRWNAAQLSSRDADFIAGWPATLRATVDRAGDVLFCHATPRSDSEIFTRLTPDEQLKAPFDGTGAALVVCGHTHMQFDRTVGERRVVNAGSVGMPFGQAGACWLLLDGDVRLRRTWYDLSAAADRIRATDYPMAMHFAEHNVLSPPGEAAMLEAFSRSRAP